MIGCKTFVVVPLIFSFITELTLMKRGYFDKDASALVSQMLGEMRYTVLISMKSINSSFLEAVRHLDKKTVAHEDSF